MKKSQTNKTLALGSGEQILASHDFNDERTVAFHPMRKKHKKDAIGWIIGGLLLFFFTLLSVGRISIVGQFLDDSIFNLIFGWFKFPVYFLLLLLDLCIYLGVYFKFKVRFLLMVSTTAVLLCWLISLVLMTYIYENEKVVFGYSIDALWSKKMFLNSFNIYWGNWIEHSIYAADYAKLDKMELLFSARGYVSLYAGGGLIGTVMAGISAYLTIPGAFILIGLLLFLDLSWLFTGDGFFCFKPKNKRKGHALRILSLKGKNNPNQKEPQPQANDDYQIWKSLNVFDPNVETAIATSDLTIKLPSFNEAERNLNLKELDDDFDLIPHLTTPPQKLQPLNAAKKTAEVTVAPTNNLPPFKYQSRRKQALDDLKNWDSELPANKVSYQDVEDLINDLPQTGHFGDLDPNAARHLFEQETNVTPFGRNQTVTDDDEEESDTQFFADLYQTNNDQGPVKK